MTNTYFGIFLFLLILTGCTEQPNNETNLSNDLIITEPKDKIWAHRVNSLEGIEERIQNFNGIEVDIYYNNELNSFEVKHDIDSSGIDLELFLDSINSIKDVLFWFDYKNLKEYTDAGILKLNAILHQRNLEKKSFVESLYGPQLEKFSGKVATSLWVGVSKIPEQASERNKLYHKKYKFILSLDISMLSAGYGMFEFISEYFPNHRCNYWISGSLGEERMAILNKMALSPNVNIILIDGNKNPLLLMDSEK